MSTHDTDQVLSAAVYAAVARAYDNERSIEDAADEILDAIEADRQRRGEPTAAEISDVIREITGCPDIKNGEDSLVVALGMLFHRCATTQSSEPDYKQLFEQMCERCDALDAKLAEYSEREPVAYAIKAANTGEVTLLVLAGEDAEFEGVPQMRPEHVIPLYTSPQPAEMDDPNTSPLSGKGPFKTASELIDSINEPVKVPSDDDIEQLAKQFGFHRVPGIIELARAIEQAVLQSEQVQALRKDSERYRWLRDMIENQDLVIAKVGSWSLESWSGDDPDHYIDAAMEQQK